MIIFKNKPIKKMFFSLLFVVTVRVYSHPFQMLLLNAIKAKQEKIACALIGQTLKGAAKCSDDVTWKLLRETIKEDCPQIAEALLGFVSVEKISYKDEMGYTLLDYANELHRTEIIEMLNKKIATITTQGNV